jgi:amphi-Trp domain-containing protein
MNERDVEKAVGAQHFAATLRRIADAVDKGESFQIQVLNKRFTVPANAALSIEHEAEGDGEEELELQFRWRNA